LGRPDRALSIVDATPIGVGSKLVVVRYRDRELVLAVNRAQTVLIAEEARA
jgi:flagellar biogenesis protein FliO